MMAYKTSGTKANKAHLRQRTYVLLSATVLTGLFAGCGQRVESGSISNTMHDMNKPTRGTEAWMWHTASDDEYKNVMAPLLGLDAAAMLDNADPLVQKTQFWLDKLDASIRDAHPDLLVNVPKPVATILKSDTANAFVAPIPVCYNIGANLSTGSGSSVDRIFLDIESGEVGSWPADMKCIDGDSQAALVFQSIAAEFNGKSLSGCQLSVNAGKLGFSSECTIDSDLQGVASAKSVAIMQTANHVTLFSAIIPLMAEPAFVSVLAHELGHYYRSHSTAPDTLYNYFYTLAPSAEDHKPTPEAALRHEGDAAYAAAALVDTAGNFATVSGQKLRSELYMVVGSLIEGACTDGQCQSACKDAKKLLDSNNYAQAIGSFPFGQSSQDQDTAYGEFEPKALACLAQIKLVSTGNITAKNVSWDAVKTLVTTPTFPTWLSRISAQGQQQLAKVNALTAARAGDQAPSSAVNMKDAMLAVSAKFATQDSAALNNLHKAFNDHIGQYTIEEEADDESAEWVAALGIDPENEVDAMHSLGAGMATSMDGLNLGATDCDALWKKNWRADDGSYAFVPIGDYAEIHHSVCYRMFNIEREIKVHSEVAKKNSGLPALGGASWKQLQDAAGRLSSAAAGGSAGSLRLSSIVRRTNAMSCTYSYAFH